MSSLVDFIKKYNQDLEPQLQEIFQRARKKAEDISPVAARLVDDYQEFVGGGKRLRGALTVLGYQMFGGQNYEEILKASLAIEIVHSFFLVQDDIMDQDELRRGKPTVHMKYQKEYGLHYGTSMALVVGDEGLFLAYYLLSSLKLDPGKVLKALKYFNEVGTEVGIGQALDLTYEREKKYTEEDVLRVHRYKTAEYSIVAPLCVGAILAGADESKLAAIKDFGIPVGVAFQLRDDELGMFSTREVLGKAVDSDLKAGKVTLLIVKALENADQKDKEFLEKVYGDRNISTEDAERVREIIKKVGAPEYSQKKSQDLVEEGKRFIPEVTDNSEYQQMLNELADLVIARES